MEKSLSSQCWLLLVLTALPAAPELAAAELHCGQELAPFSAEYQVSRNEKRLGKAEVTLEKDDDGRWIYAMETKADRGLSGLFGGHVLERTEFEYVNGQPRSLRYRYKRGISFSSRSTFAEFDWKNGRASGNFKKKEWKLPLRVGQTDRMLVNLLLMRSLAGNPQKISFATIEKGRLEEMSFARDGELKVETQAGRFQTVVVQREHRNPQRETFSWHAPELAYLPVRLLQNDAEDDETIELLLNSIEFRPCPAK